jgi:Uma2 family endonuclease
VVVVEVLSPTTAHTDTSAKLIGYFRLPSVQHYLVIDPEGRTVTHHARAALGRAEPRVASQGLLRLDPPGIEFDVTELFG